jgi:hypothetical protein
MMGRLREGVWRWTDKIGRDYAFCGIVTEFRELKRLSEEGLTPCNPQVPTLP